MFFILKDEIFTKKPVRDLGLSFFLFHYIINPKGVLMITLTDIKQLGNIIRNVRKNQNLTQQQLAAVCGVGVRFVRELEKGKESCHISKAFLVIRMLGISIEVHGDNLE